MQDGADQQGMTGLLPMVPLFERAFGIDQDVGDVLDVADFPFAAAHFEQRIVGRRFGVGWIEQQHAAVPGAETGGELPVFPFDVVDDGRARPGQQGRHDQADALARSGRGEAKHMLGAVMTEIVAIIAAEHDTVGTEQARGFHLVLSGPAGGAVGRSAFRFAGAPDRHADGDGYGDEAARRRDHPALGEDLRRVGVVEIPPPEERRRIVDRQAEQGKPGRAELRLKAEAPCDILRRRPSGEQYDEEDDGDLAPQDFGRGHCCGPFYFGD